MIQDRGMQKLQSLAVDARQKFKDKCGIKDLNELRNTGFNQFAKFNNECCKEIYNIIHTKTKVEVMIVDAVVNYNIKYNVVIIVDPNSGRYVIDPTVDYFLPVKQFVYAERAYPILAQFKIGIR